MVLHCFNELDDEPHESLSFNKLLVPVSGF